MNNIDSSLIEKITEKLKLHHTLYRCPVNGNYFEDIFDSCINDTSDTWTWGSHSSGADVIGPDGIRYQNKSGMIDFKSNTLRWSGHRTTTHKTLEEKINFISEKHCDKYAMLARNDLEWDNNIQRYYFFMIDASIIDYKALNWTERLSKKSNDVVGWVGESPNVKYTAKIDIATSHQLWTTVDLTYLHKPCIITIREHKSTLFFNYD